MFDIGFPELLLLCIVALLVLGPERMPEAVRTLGLWAGRLRRSFTRLKTEIEREVGMDDVRRQLHNESVLDEIRRLESEVKGLGAPPPAARVSPLPEANGESSPAPSSSNERKED
jgi:sec-independent protein translocase protein TatB